MDHAVWCGNKLQGPIEGGALRLCCCADSATRVRASATRATVWPAPDFFPLPNLNTTLSTPSTCCKSSISSPSSPYAIILLSFLLPLAFSLRTPVTPSGRPLTLFSTIPLINNPFQLLRASNCHHFALPVTSFLLLNPRPSEPLFRGWIPRTNYQHLFRSSRRSSSVRNPRFWCSTGLEYLFHHNSGLTARPTRSA